MKITDLKNWEDGINKVLVGDCLDLMAKMPDNCVDLTVTSPPYDNLRDYKGYSFDFENTAKELFRITKQGGVVVWVVGDATIKGSETGTSFRQALYFKEIGFNLHDTMIYRKQNYVPLTHNRYEQSFEFMFVLSKSTPKVFNPLREKTKTQGSISSRRTQKQMSARRKTDSIFRTKENKIKPNIFTYKTGCYGFTGEHPAPFPEQLASDHITSWSNENHLIFDPFMGSWTTARACKDLKRNFIGSELSEEYCQIGEQRLRQEVLL